jgi:hypothetical protein
VCRADRCHLRQLRRSDSLDLGLAEFSIAGHSQVRSLYSLRHFYIPTVGALSFRMRVDQPMMIPPAPATLAERLELALFLAGVKIRASGRRVKAGEAIAQRRPKGGIEAADVSRTMRGEEDGFELTGPQSKWAILICESCGCGPACAGRASQSRARR